MHDFLLEVSQGRYKGVSAGTVCAIEMTEEGKEQTKIFVEDVRRVARDSLCLGTCGAQMEWPCLQSLDTASMRQLNSVLVY